MKYKYSGEEPNKAFRNGKKKREKKTTEEKTGRRNEFVNSTTETKQLWWLEYFIPQLFKINTTTNNNRELGEV